MANLANVHQCGRQST